MAEQQIKLYYWKGDFSYYYDGTHVYYYTGIFGGTKEYIGKAGNLEQAITLAKMNLGKEVSSVELA